MNRTVLTPVVTGFGAVHTPTRSFRVLPCVLLLLWAASLASPALAERPPNQSEGQYLLRLNEQYLNAKAAGQWEQCAQLCEQMLVFIRQRGILKSIDLSVVDQLAAARINQGRYQEALELFQYIIREAPPTQNRQARDSYGIVTFQAFLGAGRVMRYTDDQESAIRYLQQGIEYAQSVGLAAEAASGKTDLALTLNRLGRNEEALAQLRDAIPVLQRAARYEPEGGTNRANYANSLHAMAVVYDAMGRFDLGEPYHRTALEVLVKYVGWRHNFTADIAHLFANSLHKQGRVAEAEQMYHTVISIYEATVGRQHPRTAAVINNLGRLMAYSGRYEQGVVLGREALEIDRQFFAADSPQVAIAMMNLGNIYTVENDYDKAEPLIQDALAIYLEQFGEVHPEVAQCLQLLATIRLMGGQLPEALELVDRAQAIDQQWPFSLNQAARLHSARAIILQRLERSEEAAAELEQGLALMDLQRSFSSGVERERAAVMEEYSIYYDVAVDYRAQLNDVEGIFAISESMKARSFLDELQTRNVDLMAGLSDERRRELQERETELRRQLSTAERQLDSLPPASADASQREAARRREVVQGIFAARNALYQHLAEVKSSSPAYRNLITSRTGTAKLADVQQQLATGDLVLSYTQGGDHTYVVIIRHEGAEFAELIIDDAAAAQLGVEAGPLTAKKLSAVLLAEDGGVLSVISSTQEPPSGFDGQLAGLWQVLVPESVRNELTSGDVQQLTILPAGPLALLPFEALIVSQNDEGPEYLLDAGPPIAYAPSASVMLNLANREAQAAIASEPVLTLGDPAYPPLQSDTQSAVSRQMGSAGAANRFRAGLSRLPFSGWEATWVKQHFDQVGLATTKLTGTEATEAAVRRLISGREIVHLACHGMADQSYGNFFGSLALAPGRNGDPSDDGFLSMSEIYNLDMDACELAILSACQTNYGPQQTGEGVWALSRGFLVAGARRVMASNWVVDDEAGATLVSYFASYLAQAGQDADSRDYAAALHQAKQKVRQDQRWTNPFYWSSLVLVGPK